MRNDFENLKEEMRNDIQNLKRPKPLFRCEVERKDTSNDKDENKPNKEH